MADDLERLVLLVDEVEFLIALEHVMDARDEFGGRLEPAVLEVEKDVLFRLLGDELFDVALELFDVSGQEELGVGQDAVVARIFERLGVAAMEIEQVGRRVEPDAALPDVLIEARDEAFVTPGLDTGMLL